MAPKHSDKLPAPSSSDEEEDTTSEAEEEEDQETSEPEQSQFPLTQKIFKKPAISSTPTAAAIESSESDGSESETDSESAPVITPLATKKQQSAEKPSASGVKSKAKRPVVESNSKPDQKESKRAKKELGDGKKIGDDAKKPLFQRIWSEEDEIALLEGMIEFKSETGKDPAADGSAFYEFVKNSLHMDFGIARLKDKMWRLKKKYKNHVKRGTDAFAKKHDQEAYNLSKIIWLNDGEIVKGATPVKATVEASNKEHAATQSNGKSKKIQHAATPVKAPAEASNKSIKEHDVDVSLDKKIEVGSIEEEVLSGINLIPSEKKAALEKRWKKLRIAEMELFLQRNELVSDQAKLVLDFYKSGKN